MRAVCMAAPGTVVRGGVAGLAPAHPGARLIDFGKHKCRTFADVYAQERDYVRWCLSLDKPSGRLKPFVEFCCEQNNLGRSTPGKRARACAGTVADSGVGGSTPRPRARVRKALDFSTGPSKEQAQATDTGGECLGFGMHGNMTMREVSSLKPTIAFF